MEPENKTLAFLVDRVEAPAWAVHPGGSRDSLEQTLGGQVEWSFATPWVYRALASPLTREPFLAAPRPGGAVESGACAYWSALLNVLVYSFGWARPDRGLRWWYDAGKPTDDPRLQLVSQIWDGDGQLDFFAAWLWTTPQIFEYWRLAELTGHEHDGETLPVDLRWLGRLVAEAELSGLAGPLAGGSDPLHLSTHSNGPLYEGVGRPILLRSSRAERRATLTVDSWNGWYRALSTLGASLPRLTDSSWRVDVFVRSGGWLGTYRRSRKSGLWFSGHHRHHVQGL